MNKFLIVVVAAFNIFAIVNLMNESHKLRSKVDIMVQEKESMIHTIQDLEETLIDMRKKRKK